MAKNGIERAVTMLRGLGSGDPDLAAKYIDPQQYVEHNPRSADGIEGLREYVRRASTEAHHLKVVRAFQDGDHVFTQADGLIFGQNTFFDVFRFEGDLIVEHWVFSAEAAPPNESGHTQTDGPAQVSHSEDTERNKAILRDYYETAHLARDHSHIRRYFSGDLQIRHEPGVRDGVTAFLHDVEIIMRHRTIDEIRLLLGERDFVFVAAMGTTEGEPCAYIDLYRLEGGKLVEHWGFPEKVPTQGEWKNGNNML